MSTSGSLRVDIVAPDQIMWSGAADAVSAPAAEGDMGLLPGHESVLAILRPGTVRVRTGDGVATFDISTGFLSFDDNAVTVVVGGQA